MDSAAAAEDIVAASGVENEELAVDSSVGDGVPVGTPCGHSFTGSADRMTWRPGRVR